MSIVNDTSFSFNKQFKYNFNGGELSSDGGLFLHFFLVQDLLLVHRLCPSSFFVDSFFSRRFSWIS